MATRQIRISDEKKRDAHVNIEAPRRKERVSFVNSNGQAVKSDRLIKMTDEQTYEALLNKFEDDTRLAEALMDSDPEIPFDKAGRRVGWSDRVWIRQDGSVLFCARNLLVKYNPDGEEIERGDFIDVEATVSADGNPIPWSGRLFAPEDVVRKYVIGRVVRLRHVNGLTYDFLYQMAKELSEQNKLLLVRAMADSDDGKKKPGPLIFQTNGSPYNGFLEGRVDGDSYLLRLHLSNLELKRVTT